MKPNLLAILMLALFCVAMNAVAIYQSAEKHRWIDVSLLFFREAARYRAQAQESESHLSHLRNLNWLLARQIEREKGGEQLHPSEQ